MTTEPTDDRTRFQSERRSEITQLVYDNGRVEVSDLAKRFSVTTETIRRDLSELARHHIVRRVHGGAIAFESLRYEPMLIARDTRNAEEKRKILRRAVEELPREGSVMIDSGSTLGIFADVLERSEHRASQTTGWSANLRDPCGARAPR
jgi:DeoR family fructose operon transcriptional repressor